MSSDSSFASDNEAAGENDSDFFMSDSAESESEFESDSNEPTPAPPASKSTSTRTNTSTSSNSLTNSKTVSKQKDSKQSKQNSKQNQLNKNNQKQKHDSDDDEEEDDNSISGGDSDSDSGSDEEVDSDSGDDSDSSPPQPSNISKSAVSTANSTKLHLTPKDDKEKQFYLKEFHRSTKKTKSFLIQKVVRNLKKTKEESAANNNAFADAVAKLEKDHEIAKHLNVDEINELAWQVLNDGKKISLNDKAPRERDFILMLIHHPSMKTAYEALVKKHRKQSRQQEKKLKKLQAMAESKKKKKKEPVKPAKSKFGSMKVGTIVDGIIDGVEKFGLFIDFWYKKERHRGLCHVSQISDEFIKELKAKYNVGDRVKAIVTKLDEENEKVSLGMKASLFPGGKAPAVEKLSITAAAQAEIQKQKDGDNGTESVFVESLGESVKPKKDPLLKKIKELVSVSHNATKGKNRLGQRERRKLIESVYGNTAKHKEIETARRAAAAAKKRKAPTGSHKNKSSSDSTSASTSHPHSAKSTKSANPTNSNNSNNSSSRPEKKQKTEQTTAADPELHPSWIAKQKQQGMGQFAGKKITFD